MVEKEAFQRNFLLNHQSDIFNQKDLKRPEAPYSQKAHNPNITNKTSCNFLSWDDSKNFNNTISFPNHSMKKRFQFSRVIKKKPKNLEEKLYSVDELPRKTCYTLGQKETLFMGNYDGEEFKIKKEKPKEYNPDIYFKTKKPEQIKIEQIYGHEVKRKKPALQRTKTEEKRYNTITNDPREMKYFNLYGKKKNANSNKKLETLSFDNSSNNAYNPKIDPKQNRVNMLKSNIFHDSKIEKMNTESNFRKNKDQIKVITKDKKEKNFGKKSKIDKNAEKLPSNLDWRNDKINLLFNSERDKEVIKKNARQRKFNEIYGAEPSKPKEKVEDNFKDNNRKLIEQATKNMYSDLNQAKIKKISENISQIQGNQFVDDSSKYKQKNNNNEAKTYEINSDKINEKEIEKAFADKGLHIYDIKEGPTSILGNMKNNKIVFKVRENKNDKDFDKKIKELQNDFKENKKADIKTPVQSKKKNVDLIPSSLKWNNDKSSLYTKHKNVDKTLQEKTHSKPIDNKNNNEQKVTKIFVNLKYKNKTNFGKF